MNKIALRKGLSKINYAILCAFIGPVIVMQAFQNEGHPFYYPVLIVGLVFLFGAIFLGFQGIKQLVDGLLGKKENHN